MILEFYRWKKRSIANCFKEVYQMFIKSSWQVLAGPGSPDQLAARSSAALEAFSFDKAAVLMKLNQIS